MSRPRYLIPIDIARGIVIGAAELVPGVSGGTVALVTGVYEELLGSAAHVVQAGRQVLARRPAAALDELGRTDWWLVVPVLVGMAAALLTLAGPMAAFVTESPEHARGLFLGLVAASIVVPVRMAPAGRLVPSFVIFVAAAVLAFVVTNPATSREVATPSYSFVFVAAAIAVCALVIPGVSGSFFMLAVGIYAPTLAAVHERNLPYMSVFALGMIVGLASFVQVLRWLLVHYRRGTLIFMAGLMLGSLRALWPWQVRTDEAGTGGVTVAPYDPVAGPIAFVALGVIIVAVLVVIESRARPTAA